MSHVASNDIKKTNFINVKNNILNNLANVRKEIINSNIQNLTQEYDKYFDELKKEKLSQIELLKLILEHLEKVNSDIKILENKSNNVIIDINKIKLKLLKFQDELKNIEK
jgi:esterase/lipase